MSLQSLDPYKVFKVGSDFTLDEIKQKFRRLALKLHPDKNHGNPEAAQLFAAIQHCYQELLEQYCMRISDKQYSDLKNESQEFLKQQQPRDAKRPTSGSGMRTKFDVARFNELFMQHRVGDAYDDGYGEWMKHAHPSGAQMMQNKQLTVHRPNALFMTQANTYELGVTRVQDYSKPCTVDMAATPGRGARSIEYTDYRVAHTTSQLLSPSSKTPARTSYASVDQLEKERASISHTMTPEECARYAAEQRKEAKREQRRQQALREQDQRMISQYNRMHALLAG